MFKSKRRYYTPGVDNLNFMVETPPSKERTETRRFIIAVTISTVSAVAAIIAAVVTIMLYFGV